MNQAQRAFLIKNIQESAKNRIDALKHSMPELPNLEKYILNAVMSEKFTLRSPDEIRQAIKKKVFGLTDRETLLTDSRSYYTRGNLKSITLLVGDLFVIPAEYLEISKEYEASATALDDAINSIKAQLDGLVTRIQLASDKTLEMMINEVDDMGNISLLDIKIKEIAASGGKARELRNG